jgi:tetratricopeptide (TPR) repeat protein
VTRGETQPREDGRRAALAVFVLALVVRLIHLYERRTDILFDHPILDEERYVEAARRLGEGAISEARAHWQPPGIIYALGSVFRLFGPGLVAPRIVQALVSAGSASLALFLGRRLFGPRVGLLTGGIVALHGVLVFESYELLPSTWIVFFDLCALAFLLAVERGRDDRQAMGRSLLAGLSLGISAVFAPTVLPFAVMASAWLKRPRTIAALLLGIVLPIAPVTYRNWEQSHELVPISTNGGLNFFIGNNERYPETFALRPGRRWEELTTEPDRAGIHAPGAASSYFFDKGLAFAGAHPLDAAGLYLRKLYLFFNGREIARDTDIHEAREGSGVLRALVWPPPWSFPDGLLIPCGLVGVAMAFRERRRLLIPLGFVMMQALTLALFFVSARHRIPSLPIFALFAAVLADRIPSIWREATIARRALALATAGGMIVLLNLPTREAAISCAAELDFYRGMTLVRLKGDPKLAIAHLRRATERDPSDGRFWFELGNAQEALRRPDEAVDAWRRAAIADPWDSRPRRRMSVALARKGDLGGAIVALQESVDAGLRDASHYAPDHLNLAFLHAQRGELDIAARELRLSAEADPVYFREAGTGMTRALFDAPELGRGSTSEDRARFWLAVGDVHRDHGSGDAATAAYSRARAP